MSEELYNSNDFCKLAEEFEELKKENAELSRDKDRLMNLFMERSEYVFNVVAESLTQKCKALEADYAVSNREMLLMQVEIGELKSELARRDEELAELNDKAVFIKFENEDELPAEIKDDVYSAMFECSHVDGVRLFPYIEENGQKYFLVMLKEVV